MVVGALQLHAQHSARCVLARQDYFLASHIEDEAWPARQVLHLRVSLPPILLKAERQLGIGVPPLRRRSNFRIERKARNNQEKTTFQHKSLHIGGRPFPHRRTTTPPLH